MSKKTSIPQKRKSSWPISIQTGPTENIALQGHEQSQGTIFCISINERIGEFVTGSADHSLRVWDLKTGRCKKELFKNGGHHEWITTCDYLGDDSIVSGAMDNQIIRWPKGSTKGYQIGIQNSVTKLYGIDKFVVSTGYDGCVQVWDVQSGKSISNLLVDKRGITAFLKLNSVENSIRFAVGGRSGLVALVSLNSSSGQIELLWKTPLHQEAVISLGGCPNDAKDDFVSGGGDGRCAVWREGKNVWLSPQNKGTISFVAYECGPKGQTPRVTFGTSLGEIHIIPLTQKDQINIEKVHDQPVCEGILLDSILLTGDANGMIICHELSTNLGSGEATLKWGFGALKMAVRVIAVSDNHQTILIGGEESVGMMLKFE
jgi:WD40 repeat protein